MNFVFDSDLYRQPTLLISVRMVIYLDESETEKENNSQSQRTNGQHAQALLFLVYCVRGFVRQRNDDHVIRQATADGGLTDHKELHWIPGNGRRQIRRGCRTRTQRKAELLGPRSARPGPALPGPVRWLSAQSNEFSTVVLTAILYKMEDINAGQHTRLSVLTKSNQCVTSLTCREN